MTGFSSMWYDQAADWVVVPLPLPLRVRSGPVLPTEYQMALMWNVAFFTALTWYAHTRTALRLVS